MFVFFFFFFFQAEDGIRDLTVTGVQTCALPISDDLLGLLRRAGPGRTADAPDPPGAGHGLEPKIPLYVSGFGPRAMELAGKHGDGLIFAIPPRGVAVAEALGHAHKGAASAGRPLDCFRNCALTNVA